MAKKRYFLPYELDAFDNAPTIGVACGTTAAAVVYGNMLMWRHVWRTKSDLVTTAHIYAFFGANACEALVLFGHLEASEAGWRVKGAKEWLRVMCAQSEAGKKNVGNLQKGRPNLSGSPPAYPQKRDEAGDKPTGSPPALTATSDQRPATSDQKASAGKKPPAVTVPEKVPDPRHAPLVKALVEAGFEFGGGQDAKQVTFLLAKGEPAEVVTRARRALGWPLPFPRVRTLTELVAMWPHFATDAPRSSRGPVDAGTQSHNQTGWVQDF